MSTRLEQHPLSASFPSMPEDELNALAADIRTHGLHSAIVIYKGQVLDGWHRYRACILASVNPRTMEYKGTDPVAFVKSANWHRRHMTESQRAMAQVALSEWRESGVTRRSAMVADLPPSSAEMAKEAAVSTRTITNAKAVQSKGTEAVKAAVREGVIPVHKAAEIATLPKREQNKVLAEPKPTPKPEKKDEAAPEGEDFAPNLVAELERADKEIRSLQGLVESLQTSDLAKEVAKWHLKFDQLDGRLQQCMTTGAEAAKQAKYQGELLAKIRKALRVEKNSQILPALAK